MDFPTKSMPVRRCKEPIVRQMKAMANNLSMIAQSVVKVEIGQWDFDTTQNFTIWIESEHKHYNCDSWAELQDQYYVIVKKYRRAKLGTSGFRQFLPSDTVL